MASTERFGYEWEKYHQIIPEYEGQFLKWVAPLTKSDFNGKTILDIGCGIGRNMYWPLRYGAARATGIDADARTLASCVKNLKEFPQAEVRHCSVYDLNDEGVYDIAFSIGVIHHLEKPHEAIERMVRALKPGGTIAVWVYGYEGNEWIVRYVNPLRHVLVKLPPWVSDVLSYVLAMPVYLFVKIFPQTQPYYKQLSGFRFWHIRSIVFDQLLPKIANYWKHDEAQRLFEGKGLTDISVYPVNGLSWTVIGKKK